MLLIHLKLSFFLHFLLSLKQYYVVGCREAKKWLRAQLCYSVKETVDRIQKNHNTPPPLHRVNGLCTEHTTL